MTRRVVVVGAGISGLTAAWALHRAGADVAVIEASGRIGGKLHTGTLAGRALELGADAFLARHPAAERLARRLGLGDDLVAPATGKVWLWSRGRLRPLPAGTVLGAPTDPVALARSGALPPGALVRAAVEPLLPRQRTGGDRSVADLVAERFGASLVDLLVEPLLGGVYAGRADDLSVEAAAPMLADAARRRRSLLLGLRAYRRDTASNRQRPVFLTVASGLSTLAERLAADLGDRVVTGTAATALTPDGDTWQVHTDGAARTADAVVLAVPAFAAADLLAELARPAAAELGGIRYASVGVVSLAYPASAGRDLPPGSGMLVPRTEGRLVKASTWVSRKWPHRAGGDHLLVRASVGRVDDDRWQEFADDDLVRRVDAEVRWATGITAPAVHGVVTRWPRALPQYSVGHHDRVDRIRMHLPPGIVLAGAAYDGVGISPCVASGERAAAAALA